MWCDEGATRRDAFMFMPPVRLNSHFVTRQRNEITFATTKEPILTCHLSLAQTAESHIVDVVKARKILTKSAASRTAGLPYWISPPGLAGQTLLNSPLRFGPSSQSLP